MSKHFVQSAALRTLLLRASRAYARSRFWDKGPKVFINSIPKAGTHLLTAELERFSGLHNSRLHLEIDRLKAPQSRLAADELPIIDPEKLARAVGRVRGGQFCTGHLYGTEEVVRFFESDGSRTLFMTRDPRDVLVSRFHYIRGLRRHPVHEFMTSGVGSEEEAYRIMVLGHSGPPFIRPLRATLEGYLPWMKMASVLTVGFEDLVGARGGGSNEAKLAALHRIAAHCGLDTAGLDRIAETPTKPTPTLRSGQTGAWRKNLPPEIIRLIESECGDLIEAMGYSAA